MKIKDKSVSDIWSEIKNIMKTAEKYTPSVILFTVMSLLSAVFGLLTSLVSQSLIDFVTGDYSGGILKFGSIYAAIGAAVAFAVFRIVFGAVNSRISEKIRIKVNTEISAGIFDSFICSEWESSSAFASGDILNRFGSDASTVAGSVLGVVPTLIVKLFQFAAAFCVILYYDRVMALIALISVPLSLICSRFLVKKMHMYAREIKKAGSVITSFESDALLNMQYIKSFGLVTVFCAKLRQLQKEYINLSLDYNKFSVIITAVMSFITQMITYACFGWGVYRLYKGAISFGTLVLFVQLYSMLSSSFSSLAGVIPTVINAAAASERLTQIKNLPKEEDMNSPEAIEFYERAAGKDIKLNMRGVTFKYKGEEENALENADLACKSGDFVALTGPSGEGKTTVLRILLSLVSPDEGDVTISLADGGSEISVSPATRRFFSYVPQKNTMFADTLAANMRFVKPDASDGEIAEALKTACAYDFVLKEKDGIYCRVGDGGAGFSEGQMQRLSIARAVLRNSKIALFDESTSALDSRTEKQVLQNLAEWGKDKICIFTTHRASVFDVCSKAYSISGSQCVPYDGCENEGL